MEAMARVPESEPEAAADRLAPQAARSTVLFVEASSGGVVGGSLTGLVHQMRGMDSRWRSAVVLYEPKSIEPDLRRRGIPVHHIRRWRIPKEHALRRYEAYHSVRKMGAIRSGLHFGRVLLRTAAEELPAALALARIIRAERADVVHVGNGLRANYDAVLACWLTRTPCVCHVKGFEKYGPRERWSAPYVDALVCMTEAVKRHCEELGVRGPRMPVIYDAIDADGFRPRRDRESVRVELGLSADACGIGIIGGIQEWKGQGVVVEAMARLRATAPVHCFIVGGVHRAGQQYASEIRQRVLALRLEGRVTFLGFRDDVPDIVNALDVIVHASVRPEPFGRVILESMLLSRPVVAANAGGVPEFVDEGKTGFLVSPGDAAALARRISELVDDRVLRERIGAEAHAAVLRRFGLPEHVRAMTELYDTLIEGR